MKAIIEIELDNTGNGNENWFLSVVLRELINKIDLIPKLENGMRSSLKDLNGNTVGYFAIYK